MRNELGREDGPVQQARLPEEQRSLIGSPFSQATLEQGRQHWSTDLSEGKKEKETEEVEQRGQGDLNGSQQRIGKENKQVCAEKGDVRVRKVQSSGQRTPGCQTG